MPRAKEHAHESSAFPVGSSMADTKQVSVAVASDDADAEEQIRCFVGLGAGIAKDVRRRWPLYVDDWLSLIHI